jgi:hypothetical protein
MPGVYYLPESVRRALRFEQTMRAVDCGTPEPEVEVPPLAWPVDVEAFDLARAEREVEVLYSVPAPVATDEDIERFRAAAYTEGKAYPCVTDGCMHTAPAHGDACPVCADDRRRSVFDRDGDAA